ncbi:GPW/gp25 family protein [Francisella philomiragia]|uniref:25-like lysozyme family protein n=1 Tax=Francisella philomiragia TaxID=28110 RepID=A0A0B6CV24_9GAMM|nr:GPW/gp25 family protein [Francisella philomiragia]AJI52715.1 25-like lysozyme family protein [Francisella philomiragia]
MAYDRETGKQINDYIANIKQQITEILQTPKTTRLKNRKYGCELYKLIDKPINEQLKREVVRIVYEAIVEQLSQVKVLQVLVEVEFGKLVIHIEFEVNNQIDNTDVAIGNIYG